MKGFAPISLILVTIIVIGIAAGAYLLATPNITSNSQTGIIEPKPSSTVFPTSSDETVSWKSYTSKVLKLSFLYPASYHLNEDIVNAPDESYNSIHIQNIDTSIQIVPMSKGENNFYGNSIKPEMILIGGESAEMYVYPPSDKNVGHIVLEVKHNGTRYEFSFNTFSSEFGKFPRSMAQNDVDFFKKFLSTIRFTDEAGSPTPLASCLPRPKCLDSTPRCLIAEPINGWCKM